MNKDTREDIVRKLIEEQSKLENSYINEIAIPGCATQQVNKDEIKK